jgi:hypothetical protein
MPLLASLLRSLTGVEPASKTAAQSPVPTTSQALPPHHPGTAPHPPATAPEPVPEKPRPYTHVLSRRSFRQLGLYFGGCSFLAFSILVSRRAAVRHQLRARLRYFTPNTQHSAFAFRKGEIPAAAAETGKEPLMALEALNLATINVVSFGILMAGGVSWALDVSSMEDMRWWARRGLGGVHGKLDEEAEKELAEWVAKTLGMDLDEEEQGKAEGGEEGKP